MRVVPDPSLSPPSSAPPSAGTAWTRWAGRPAGPRPTPWPVPRAGWWTGPRSPTRPPGGDSGVRTRLRRGGVRPMGR
ncbi:hypothetical protein E1285_08775 [Actinomadura sp. 7K507]|nr:hypothetical protein E1285_08775 [Actinomadura sp. 7K507]